MTVLAFKSSTLFKLFSVIIVLSFNSCKSVEVVNSWQSDNIETIKPKNVLVIARTANERNRIAFENEITKRLESKGINAVESYKKFPKIDPNNKLTDEKIQEIKKLFKDEGFNAVVVSVVKDTQELHKSVTEGGYEAGASIGSYYYYNNVGFYGYYLNPVSYPSFEGVYQEQTIQVQTAKAYVLETSAYNLDLPEKEQLLAVVTSKIVDPIDAHKLADEYAKVILKSLKK